MYKLFLSFRYLRRRPIALVAIVSMALCVFMVLVVASVMNGFLDAVENAARGMRGDVIAEGRGGIPHYDEFIAELEGRPEIAAASPVIRTAGLLKFGPRDVHMVYVVGIKLPEATKVTSFGEGLFPPQLKADPAFRIPPALVKPLEAVQPQVEADIAAWQRGAEQRERRLEAEQAKPEDEQDAGLIAALENDADRCRQFASQIKRQSLYMPQLDGLILGVDIPYTTQRNPDTGQYTRRLGIPGANPGDPGGEKAQLILLPLGRGSVGMLTEPVKKAFHLVGDHRFGLYLVDSAHVYVDFDVLQRLLEMDGRCDQIQIRIAAAREGRVEADDATVLAGAGAVREVWAEFAKTRGLATDRVDVETWRQKHAQYIDAIEKQRDLMVIILGIVSMVAVVLVFAIFYMLVVQKTKDIGMACVFLIYGSAVGLVGSVFGAIGGRHFVRNINAVHDWIARVFGWRVFSRQAYMFDKIPDQVDPWTIVAVMIGAMVAGLIGALLPAARAARMQPVEALRYE